MKRLEYLIKDVRRGSDNTDVNGVKDAEIIEYFNDGIALIQLLIFKNQPHCVHFLKEAEYAALAKDTAMDLPTDCYADSALSTVLSKHGSCFHMVPRVKTEDLVEGFLIKGKKLFLNYDGNEGLKLEYFKRLPRFDKRWGKIDSVVGNVINLSQATDSDLSEINDTISIVDADGVVIQADVKVSTFTLPTSITSSTALSGSVAAGQYIVSGGYSSTLCELPQECETYLKDYVKQRIFTRNNYTDAASQGTFTDLQQKSLVELFSNDTKDLTTAPITDTDFLWI